MDYLPDLPIVIGHGFRGAIFAPMKGGPSAAQIKAQQNAAKKQEMQMAKMLAQQAAASAKALKSLEVPAVKPVKLEPAPPTATMTSGDQMAASMDASQQAGNRYGLTKTRVAGETGGYLGGGSSALGGATLLTV